MNENYVIQNTQLYVKNILESEGSGHDWFHIERVTKTAVTIAEKENANLFVCELAALLHDIADEKICGDEQKGLGIVREWLSLQEVPENTIDHVLQIISKMSFKGGNNLPLKSLEGKIVQDADRLDAIGAIGIARCFVYSGAKGQLIYDPALKPRAEMTNEEYRKGKSTAVNHFYEKLLKLKGLMNTKEGKRLADERHLFMENFLKQFYKEWNGTQ
ncbi:HD domain-containing protein [Bacillus taeanensis]|uniref:Phosphohydrolase n=1 Tax=Bacillus taeanensis TaxID=273032 RepID=A0A366XYP7_9BACI|nr:HD domain-containing protein [Bacillus taeanensis]RBW71037.1 phosphohydrolase [Bacillus taeanensis]